jgi:hypothetical protein
MRQRLVTEEWSGRHCFSVSEVSDNRARNILNCQQNSHELSCYNDRHFRESIIYTAIVKS